MAKLFDFKKGDDAFVASTLVAEKRKRLIERLEKIRKLYFTIFIFTTPLFFLTFFLLVILDLEKAAPVVIMLFAMFIYFRIDDRLKMLKTIDRMESSEE